MADDLLALADILGDGLDLAPHEISDVTKAVPMLNALSMDKASNGVAHSYVKQTAAPVVGFRDVNAGRDLDHSAETKVTVNLKYLDFSWSVDVAAARGLNKSPEWLLAREGRRHVSAALTKFEQQVINGIVGASDSAAASGDASGFAGFRDAATIDAVADSMVVSAGNGTTDANTSVYGIRLATDGVVGIYNGDGPAVELSEPTVVQRVVDPGTDNKTHAAWYQEGGIWLALQIGGAYDLGRIANLDDTNGLTDDLISDLLSLYPVGFGPTHLVCSRKSLKALQQSRTATTTTGAPAPFPTEAFGVPLIVSDNVSDTEEILS